MRKLIPVLLAVAVVIGWVLFDLFAPRSVSTVDVDRSVARTRECLHTSGTVDVDETRSLLLDQVTSKGTAFDAVLRQRVAMRALSVVDRRHREERADVAFFDSNAHASRLSWTLSAVRLMEGSGGIADPNQVRSHLALTRSGLLFVYRGPQARPDADTMKTLGHCLAQVRTLEGGRMRRVLRLARNETTYPFRNYP